VVSDKKGIKLFEMDGNSSNRWGESAQSIDYEKLGEVLGIEAGPLAEIFGSLYPNSKAPSDHPPVVVEVQF